jgi:hypothetical protein
MKLNKVFKITFLAVGFMLLSFGYSFASFSASSLTQYVLTDTTSQLSLHWDWTQGAGSATTTYLSANWQANLTIIPMSNGYLDVAVWGFQHLIGPHPEDIDPATFFSTGDIAIGADGTITQSGVWDHPTTSGQMHHDLWTFTFDRTTGDADLTVTHTPIPATLLLFSSGLLGLFGIGRKRLFVNE